MLARTPLGNRFYNFINTQDPERRYQWSDNCRCACSHFLQEELGLSQNEASDAFHAAMFPIFSDRQGSAEAKETWLMFNDLAQDAASGKYDWTYGGLARRVAAAYPEFV